MIRNLKILGLAIVAVLAMSEVAIPTASAAEDLTAETSPVTLTGKQTGAGDVFTTTAGTVKCKEVKYAATSVAMPTTAMNLAPTYPLKTVGGEQNCTGFGFPAEIQTNACTYNFTIGAATAGGVDILCPEGKEITVIANAAGTTKCTVHVPAQTIVSGVTYSDTGSGTTREIDITANISNAVAYKHTIGTGLGACAGGTGTGSYTGTALVTGETGAGAHAGIFFNPTAPPVYDLTAETSPVTLTGKQTGAGDVFTTTAGTVNCKEVKYAAASIAMPTTAVNLAPSYPVKTAGGEQNCTGFGFPAEIHTNECTYNFTIGAAKAGGVDILCPAGKEITITAISASTLKCVVHVPAQTIASGITYSDTGSGTTREIDITANISNAVTYKHTPGTGVGSCAYGAGSGSYTGTAVVTGENGVGAHTGIFFAPPPPPDDLTAETWPVTLTGKQTGSGDTLTTTVGAPSCKEVKYTATNVVTPTTVVTVTPSYPLKTVNGEHNCSGSGFPWEINTNGCTYRFTISEATKGSVDIICPEGKEITMILSSAGTIKCTVHVPAQTLASSVTYSNTGSGATREVTVTTSIAFTYKHTAGTGIGPCTTGHGTGSYSGSGVVTGENGAGTTHVGVFLS